MVVFSLNTIIGFACAIGIDMEQQMEDQKMKQCVDAYLKAAKTCKHCAAYALLDY